MANGIESTGRLPMLYGAGDEHGQSAETTRKEVLVSETCKTLSVLSWTIEKIEPCVQKRLGQKTSKILYKYHQFGTGYLG